MRIKFLASVTAALSLAFIPTMAQAVATTLTLNEGGTSTAATGLEDGDSLDVTVAGPVAKTGPATHELYSTWSAQSLGLDVFDTNSPSDDITWPEGWSLEYTTNGTTWVDWQVTAPSDLSAVIAIRSLGDVNSVGENMFKTTSNGSLKAMRFNGSGIGDGFDVAVGSDRVYNVWHHQENTISVDCHYFDGSWCETDTWAISGYSNSNASRAFFNDTNNHLYTYVMRDSDSSYGVLCVDYSDPTTVSTCDTEYVMLNNDASGYDRHDYGTQSQDGSRIWSIEGTTGKLMCFDIEDEAACTGGDNGFITGATDNSYAIGTARVTAVNGLVFWTLDDKFGCYNDAANAACNGSSPITLSDTENRHAPFPVENTSGVLIGACDLYTRLCIDTDGASMTIPASLNTFWDNNPGNHDVAMDGYEQFAYGDHRFYYETDDDTGWGSNSVVCFDYLTALECDGFNGAALDGLEDFYAATLDSSTPGCLWINQDSGLIIPINAETGVADCDLGNPTVQLAYDAMTPRMSCNEEGRVTQWASIKVAAIDGVPMSDVRVSFFDSDGNAVTDWTDLTPDANGVVDLTGLDINATGTQPTIEITAGDITNAQAEAISATVTFVAEDPQLCFTLSASNNCETTVVDSPPAGSIADGIVEGTSITRPDSGKDVGTKERTTLPGANAADMCVASALEIDLPISQLASTGVDAGGIAIAGFAVLAAGVAAVAVTRRRKA